MGYQIELLERREGGEERTEKKEDTEKKPEEGNDQALESKTGSVGGD